MTLATELVHDEAIVGCALDEVSVVRIGDRLVVVPVAPDAARESGFEVLAVDDEFLFQLGVVPAQKKSGLRSSELGHAEVRERPTEPISLDRARNARLPKPAAIQDVSNGALGSETHVSRENLDELETNQTPNTVGRHGRGKGMDEFMSPEASAPLGGTLFSSTGGDAVDEALAMLPAVGFPASGLPSLGGVDENSTHVVVDRVPNTEAEEAEELAASELASAKAPANTMVVDVEGDLDDRIDLSDLDTRPDEFAAQAKTEEYRLDSAFSEFRDESVPEGAPDFAKWPYIDRRSMELTEDGTPEYDERRADDIRTNVAAPLEPSSPGAEVAMEGELFSANDSALKPNSEAKTFQEVSRGADAEIETIDPSTYELPDPIVVSPLVLEEAVPTALHEDGKDLEFALEPIEEVVASVDLSTSGSVVLTVHEGHDSPVVLTAEDLAIGWPGHPALLSDLDLELLAGDVVLLKGAERSGKSSVLRALAGHISPLRGVLTIGDEKVSALTDVDRRRRAALSAGYIGTDPVLVPELSVVANVEIPLLAAGVAPAMARAMTLERLVNAGLTEIVDQPVESLSTGSKRTVAVLRTLISSPKFIAVDDVTAGVGRETASLIVSLLEEAQRNGAILMISTTDMRLVVRGAFTAVLAKALLVAV